MSHVKQILVLLSVVASQALFMSTQAYSAVANDRYINLSGGDNLVQNGSFNINAAGSITNNDITSYSTTTLLAGWSAFNPTNGPVLSTPDIMNTNANFGNRNASTFSASPTASPDGESWLGLARSLPTNGNELMDEGIKQTIDFTSTGTYRLSWYEANFGYVHPTDSDVSYLGANTIVAKVGSKTFNNSQSNLISVGNNWVERSFDFNINQTGSRELSFSLLTTDRSYLSLDGVSISAVSAVPEPEAWAMIFAGLMLLGFKARKQKRNS